MILHLPLDTVTTSWDTGEKEHFFALREEEHFLPSEAVATSRSVEKHSLHFESNKVADW